MAFPYVTEATFEDGTDGHFDTETDTESRLDIAHYSALARVPGLDAPFRGAYCLRVNLANDGTPADAYVQETGSWDMTAGTNDLYQRFYLYLSPDLTMTTTNEFAVMEYWSGTADAEAGVYVNFTTANGFRLGFGKATASAFTPLNLGRWICVETFFDPAGGGGGTFSGYVDGSLVALVTGLTNANITSGVFGVVGQDAGTTAGYVLIDQIVADDARIFPIIDRYPEAVLLTQSGHVFVGEGEVESVELLSGAGTDCVLSVFDTDTGYTSAATNVYAELKNTANSERVAHDWPPLKHIFRRGCYIAISGTNPRALVKVRNVAYYDPGAIRKLGLARKPDALMG